MRKETRSGEKETPREKEDEQEGGKSNFARIFPAVTIYVYIITGITHIHEIIRQKGAVVPRILFTRFGPRYTTWHNKITVYFGFHTKLIHAILGMMEH